MEPFPTALPGLQRCDARPPLLHWTPVPAVRMPTPLTGPGPLDPDRVNPQVSELVTRWVLMLCEVLRGSRPVAQLRDWLNGEDLARLTTWCGWVSGRPVRPGTPRCMVPTRNAIEAAVRLDLGPVGGTPTTPGRTGRSAPPAPRTLACALRLERRGRAWRCAQLGILPPQGWVRRPEGYGRGSS